MSADVSYMEDVSGHLGCVLEVSFRGRTLDPLLLRHPFLSTLMMLKISLQTFHILVTVTPCVGTVPSF